MKKVRLSNIYQTACVMTVAIVFAAVALTGGCGKKAPPEPPSGSRPPRVRDLGYGITGNTIKLSWTIPRPDETAQLQVTGFLIYRAQQPIDEQECPNCPVMFKEIGDVPARGGGPGQAGQLPITFAETIVSGYRYTYKVHGYSDDRLLSQSSNFIEFIF